MGILKDILETPTNTRKDYNLYCTNSQTEFAWRNGMTVYTYPITYATSFHSKYTELYEQKNCNKER